MKSSGGTAQYRLQHNAEWLPIPTQHGWQQVRPRLSVGRPQLQSLTSARSTRPRWRSAGTRPRGSLPCCGAPSGASGADRGALGLHGAECGSSGALGGHRPVVAARSSRVPSFLRFGWGGWWVDTPAALPNRLSDASRLASTLPSGDQQGPMSYPDANWISSHHLASRAGLPCASGNRTQSASASGC